MGATHPTLRGSRRPRESDVLLAMAFARFETKAIVPSLNLVLPRCNLHSITGYIINGLNVFTQVKKAWRIAILT
jgi:hypothetical protein